MARLRVQEQAVIAAWALVWSTLAGAGGPLANPGFDIDLAGWEVMFGRPAEWSPLDSAGAAGSGSARITNVLAPSTGATPMVLRQCLEVVRGKGYLFGAEVLVPDTEPLGSAAYVTLYTYQSDYCEGTVDEVFVAFTLGAPGSWHLATDAFRPESDVGSVHLQLGVYKPAGEVAPASGHFDNAFFELDEVFFDNFDRSKLP